MPSRLLRIPEVARALGIPGGVVLRLIERGELRAVKGPDGFIYVPERALEEYGQSHIADHLQAE